MQEKKHRKVPAGRKEQPIEGRKVDRFEEGEIVAAEKYFAAAYLLLLNFSKMKDGKQPKQKLFADNQVLYTRWILEMSKSEQ